MSPAPESRTHTQPWSRGGTALYATPPAWEFSASYLYNTSTVLSFSADPSLAGKRVLQVPKHTYTLGAQYKNSQIIHAAIQGRFVGDQFEDDRNQNVLSISSFFTVNVQLWRPLPLPLTTASLPRADGTGERLASDDSR